MDITVVVCTHNRCEILAKALHTLAESKIPGSTSWEILVVDNNSSDQTPEIVKSFCAWYPGRFRYLFEPRPGKSYALNAAIRESYGSMLAFVDDDATVEPTWLQRLTAPLRSSTWSGAGGPVILQWTRPRPRWLSLEGFGSAPLAGFNRGTQAGETGELFGTNMAFRRTMFEKYGDFRTDLGPSPNPRTPRPNEDAEFVRRILEAGEHLFYEPSAVVYHPVPDSRLQKSYFLTWWFDKGRGDLVMLGVPSQAKWFVSGIPLRLFRSLIISTVRWLIAFEPANRFSRRLEVQYVAGMIVESRRQSREAMLGQDKFAQPVRERARSEANNNLQEPGK
jgi:glycosyltransferase involved in cell wall biosynthesis